MIQPCGWNCDHCEHKYESIEDCQKALRMGLAQEIMGHLGVIHSPNCAGITKAEILELADAFRDHACNTANIEDFKQMKACEQRLRKAVEE